MLQHELPQDHVCVDFMPDGAPEEGYAIQVSTAGRYTVAYDVHEDLRDLVIVDESTGLITCDAMPFTSDFEDPEGEREGREDRNSFLVRLVPCPDGGQHVHVRVINHPDGDDFLFVRGVRPRLQVAVLSIGSPEELERALGAAPGSLREAANLYR